MSTELEIVALFQTQYRIIGLAKLAGALDDGLEDGSHFGRRGRYHPQNIAAPSLVGESLREIAGPGLHLIEQPYVFDGDHRLVGESGYKLDLLVREPPHRFPGQHDNSDRNSYSHERDAKYGTIVSPRTLFDITVFGISLNIDNLDHFSLEHGSSKHRTPIQSQWMIVHVADIFRRIAVACNKWISVASRAMEGCTVGLAQPRGRFHERIEHRLQIERRAADDLEHVGCRRLLLRRVLQVAGFSLHLIE